MAKMDSQGLGDFFYNVQNVGQYENLLKKTSHGLKQNMYTLIVFFLKIKKLFFVKVLVFAILHRNNQPR